MSTDSAPAPAPKTPNTTAAVAPATAAAPATAPAKPTEPSVTEEPAAPLATVPAAKPDDVAAPEEDYYLGAVKITLTHSDDGQTVPGGNYLAVADHYRARGDSCESAMENLQTKSGLQVSTEPPSESEPAES